MKRLLLGLIFISLGFAGLWALANYLHPYAKKMKLANSEKEICLVSSRGMAQWSFLLLIQTYKDAWRSIQAKVEQIQKIQEENNSLRHENAQLKVDLGSAHFRVNTKKSLDLTHKKEKKLSLQTGSKMGRALESLSYRPPKGLIPSQLFTLGVSYLKAHEDEKVAVIFTTLTSAEESRSYRSAQNYLTTGVAWYRLENYTMAEHYFDEVLRQEEIRVQLPYLAQARLWKAVIAKHFNKEEKTQYWLKKLIDHHPHSEEAAWVNVIK